MGKTVVGLGVVSKYEIAAQIHVTLSAIRVGAKAFMKQEINKNNKSYLSN